MAAPPQDFWSRFTLDPRSPAHRHLRAGDPDRDLVQSALGQAYAEGRISREEHDQRAEHVGESRSLGELITVLDDLMSTAAPAPSPPAPSPRTRQRAETLVSARIGRHWVTAGGVLMLAYVIGLLGPGGPPVPLLVLGLLLVVRALRTTVRRRELVLARERSLHRRELAAGYRAELAGAYRRRQRA